jgi:two-component system, NarL family, sensor histidine kinase FusK
MLPTMMPDDRFVPEPLLEVPGWCLASACFPAAWLLGTTTFGFWHWNLFAGFVFAMYWLSPIRAWPWIVLGAGVSCSTLGMIMGGMNAGSEAQALLGDARFLVWVSGWIYVLGNWADWLLFLLPAYWLRRRVASADGVLNAQGTALLHVAALGVAVLGTATDLLYVLEEGFVADVRRGIVVDPVVITPENAGLLLGTFALKNALGYFLGTMLVAPLLFWGSHREFRRHSRHVVRDAVLWLGPAVVGFIALTQAFPGSQLAELLRLLLLAAVIVFAVRHGWRGAAFSVLIVSVALGIEDHLGGSPQSPIWLQMFVAIAGAMALMFGATVDQLRLRSQELAATREKELAAAKALAESAARNVRAEEEERAPCEGVA